MNKIVFNVIYWKIGRAAAYTAVLTSFIFITFFLYKRGALWCIHKAASTDRARRAQQAGRGAFYSCCAIVIWCFFYKRLLVVYRAFVNIVRKSLKNKKPLAFFKRRHRVSRSAGRLTWGVSGLRLCGRAFLASTTFY